jgi:hypothetical protein
MEKKNFLKDGFAVKATQNQCDRKQCFAKTKQTFSNSIVKH